MKTKFEPYRVKVVEPITVTTAAERHHLLEQAGLNLFNLRAQDVIIDLLTDSGTSAMSAAQWGAVMQADESYAGAASFERFQASVRDLFGFPYVLPVHQGRAAERILFETAVRRGQIVPSNTHFDTTRANLERIGATALDLPGPQGKDIAFGGDMDLEKLQELLETSAGSIPFGMLTLTNNGRAGQPVSMQNIAAVSRLLARFGKELFIDGARCVENAFFIKLREPGFEHHTISDITAATMRFAAGCLMSAKKDAFANIGGFLAVRDQSLFQQLKLNSIVTEGFATYGGLSGRDLEAIAVGLCEVTDANYLNARWDATQRLTSILFYAGIPVVLPPAMHAVYLDAGAFFPHWKPEDLPGQALVCELYLEAGIRACEIGTVMFGANRPAGSGDLVRLALPRRLYTQSHYDYVAEAVINVFERRDTIAPLRIVESADAPLRHFTARFERVEVTDSIKPSGAGAAEYAI